ncbi:Cytochrome P450 ClCP1 [Venustampulla echinocandica]|uniref:Cytochrome P450 ClCP1 n=1 Tax=Venustampulla echinocandica TaxID=2656787 RepID=A0A370THA3_9HELO|nr:Cytochrome P450 ClCP1 [Venustampulla echinocandica]RDL34574.1 Cytochrome P450 ClCP1 [Venustampulla echinocandica]
MAITVGDNVWSYAVAVVLGYLTTSAIYNAYFHPLAKFRGPKLWSISRIPFIKHMLAGTLPYRIKDLHDQYGSIVRVAPDELSFIDSTAWKDIYLQKAFIRPKVWGSRPPGVEAHNVISAPVADHTRFRKVLQPAFSEKAVRQHEPTIERYVDLLIGRLEEAIQGSKQNTATVDLVQWINFTTFDIIGDLGWGSSFRCLEDTSYHPWIKVVLHFKAVLVATSIKYYPWVEAFLMSITPKSAMADLEQALATAHSKVKDRLSREPDHPDIMTHVIEHNKLSPETGLSQGEIEANSMAIVVAGSETLTTALAGALHHLLKDPKAFKTVVDEIRANSESEDQITAASLASLPYLTAVLNETLRISPPLPDGLRREVPKGGAIICGHMIPEKMTVSVPCWATFQSKSNFVSPDVFLPERWLSEHQGDDSPYKNDNKSSFHPFSMGPHNCIGQTLAWVEMRIILSRLLWNFDIEVPDGKVLPSWTQQKIYWTWEKQSLDVQLKKATRSTSGPVR